jgi:hypothetical protein
MPPVKAFAAGFLASMAASAATFSTSLGGPGVEVFASGASVGPDSSFEAVVFVRDWEAFGDTWVVRFDPDGGIDWASEIGGDLSVARELESGGRVVSLPDGSLLVSAQGEPRATGRNADACVMKVVPGVGTEWGVVIGEDDEEVYNINGLAAFDDGSFVAAGNAGCGEFTPFANLYHANGDRIRSLDVDDSLYVVGADITRDGQILLATFTMYEMRIHLLWFGSDGRLMRRASPFVDAGYTEDPGVFSVLASASGRIYLCGYLGGKPWIGCLSPDGGIVWDDTREAVGRTASMVDAGGGRIVCCGNIGGGNARSSAFVMEFDPDGIPTWMWLYEAGETCSFEDVALAPDGGFLLAGSRDLGSADPLWTEAWVVKTDSIGLVGGLPGGVIPDEGVICTPEVAFQSMTRPGEGWIIACGVYETAQEATLSATDAADATSLQPGVLWIPDYPSLSGYQGWLAYLVPEGLDGPEWARTGSLILEACPDSYIVWIGEQDERRRRPLFLEE